MIVTEHFYLWNTSHLFMCVLEAPLHWTTSKWLPAAWERSASIVQKFPGLKWAAHASLWHSNLAPLPWLLLTRSNRRAADQRPFLDSFCDHFSCVSSQLTSAACNCFVAWFIQPFVPQPGRSMKVKLGGIETWKKKNPTWQLLSSAETACMYLLKCVCLHSTQAVQMMPPTADGEAYLTTTRKVENKT